MGGCCQRVVVVQLVTGRTLGSFKNTLNTTLNKMVRLDKMIAFSVLIIVMILVCLCLVISYRELGRPIFLEGVSDSIRQLSQVNILWVGVFTRWLEINWVNG
jgi:hypothetical protein